MIINATTESNAQVIGGWWAYTNNNQWWSGVRLVGWISQNKDTLKTTLYTKWQRNQYNYWPYWNDAHTYSVNFGGQTRSNTFNLPSVQSNGVYNLTTAQSITVLHNSSGEYSGTLTASGYKTWESFSENFSISFPKISVPSPTPTPEPEPEPEPDPPTPLEFDNNPRFYIYSDGKLVYGAGIEGYEVLRPKLILEVNKAGSLTFDIPVGSEMYNQISKLKSTVEVRQGNEILFRGRLLDTKRTMMNTVSCYCEGFISWLNDISLEPYTFNGQARDLLKQYLTWYNSRVSANKQITYKYSDISAKISVEQKDYSNVWNEVRDVLTDGVGGFVVPYLTASETGVQWLSTYGSSTSQVIQFGKNLLDFEEYIDASEVFTAVRPLGKEVNGTRVKLTEGFVTDAAAIEMFGRIERTVIFDEVTTESALRTLATEYLRLGVEQSLTMKLKAVDLHLLDVGVERIRLGDSVRCVSVPHGIDAFFLCTKIVFDMEHLKNSEYTFGATRRTISELTDASYKRYVITEGA